MSQSEGEEAADIEEQGEETDDLMGEEEEHEEEHKPIKHTFFSEVSMQELTFGIGTLGVNCLCFGMMLNIPTLKLHDLMYPSAPNGLLHPETTDEERVGVSRAIIDYWYTRTKRLKPKKRFKQLYDVFKYLREKKICAELQRKFEADEPISLDDFREFDMGRLGPYVPPTELAVEGGMGEEEGYGDYEQY